MNGDRDASRLIGRLAKSVLVVGGVLVIVLALGVGAFRLFVARVPAHQSDLQAWVAAELGLLLSFDRLDVRWGLRGPELTLHDVTIADAESAQFIVSATRAAVGLDPVALVVDRQPRVSRLTVEGLDLTVERTADGRFRLAGAASAEAVNGSLAALVPREVEVSVRDSRVRYVDAGRGLLADLGDVTMSLTRTAEALAIDARALEPSGLGSLVELEIDAALAAGNAAADQWRAAGEVRDADLRALAALMPATAAYGIDGAGDVALQVQWSAGRITRAGGRAALREVVLDAGPGGGGPRFEQLDFTAALDLSAGGWQLTLDEVELVRDGRPWQPGGTSTFALERDDGVLRALEFRSDFLRLEDLGPFVAAFAQAPPAQQWADLNPRGELRGVDFALVRDADDAWDYSLAAEFDGLGLAATAGRPGIAGLTGAIATDARSGTVEFASGEVVLDWPELFAAPLAAERVAGSLVWRQGRDVVRVVSSDLTLGLLGSDVRSSLELTLPLDGSAPHLDIESTGGPVDLVAAKRFLPVHKMPRPVVAWLQSAVRAGTGRNLEFAFFGPVDAFPFDEGEGHFRVAADVEGVELAFIEDWPIAEDIYGTVEFVNSGFKARGGGRIYGNRSEAVEVEIPELRAAVLQYASVTRGPLEDVMAFLRAAPLIAEHLGPGYDRLRVHGGTGTVDLDLDLPLLDRARYELDARLRIAAGELSIDGFGPHATEVAGVLEVDGATVRGTGIEAVFLDGPVSADVVAPGETGYRAALDVSGETTADGVLSAFELPLQDRLAGQTRWQGRLLLPARAGSAPLRVEVESNLSGLALKFPAPLDKAPGDPSNLQLEFEFPAGGGLAVDGNLGAARRFALRFTGDGRRFELDRGIVHFGGERPQLPDEPGLLVQGTLPGLDVGDWLGLARGSGGAAPKFLGAQLEIAELSAFGQQLGASSVDARRDGGFWNIDLVSEAIAGNLRVPTSLAARPQIEANMERIYLAGAAAPSESEREAGAAPSLMAAFDPSTLPGLRLHAAEFGIGARRLGRVEAEVVADPLGLALESFVSTTDSFTIRGSGSWLRSPAGGARTQVAVSIASGDVGTALEELGFSRFMDGETAELTATIHWPGAPSAAWLDHVNGDVAVRVETGSLLEIDPGAGRVVGLLSIAALPRRLALDFRDVFNRGFVFDEIGGNFTLIDGDAYTDNLKMAGPGAEIGIVGRTGLRARDYQQQAVVTAEPGNMLPTVGALVAGPGVGAAWLLFTRIFKEPLKGIGRASYCVTGTWDEPAVERLSGDRIEEAEHCAALPPAGFSAELREQDVR